MRIIFILLCLFIYKANYGQFIYPQEYFKSPMDIDLRLSGTFAELRTNHFHSGLDIKTNQREGLNIYASAAGYVSRIKIQHFGYGKALYITHPNGYTTVYAHLKSFSPKIEAYVKAKQYENETYEIELFPNAEELKVLQAEVIALSGNTGSSGGPHLHFEIRDHNEHPINPMLFGLRVPDNIQPTISALYAYPLNEKSHINYNKNRTKLRLIPIDEFTYRTEPIEAFGEIAFSVATIDKQNFTNNSNGVYAIKTTYNGQTIYEIDYSKFSFEETGHLNRLIDYELYKTENLRSQKLFIDSNNPLSLYKNTAANGKLDITENTNGIYKIHIRDFENNETTIHVNLTAKAADTELVNSNRPIQPLDNTYRITANTPNNFSLDKVSIAFENNSFYEDFDATITLKNDTLSIHEDIVPLKKSYQITYDLDITSSGDLKPLYIAKLQGKNQYPSYIQTKKQGSSLIGTTKSLGIYAIASDTEAPSIKPLNFSDKKWISANETLKVKIEDRDSGISNYRATINGKWILMAYEYKTNTLTYNFSDGIVKDTEHNFKLIVTDNVGNSSTYESVFYRKPL